jgi:signal transduction histidine kinase
MQTLFVSQNPPPALLLPLQDRFAVTLCPDSSSALELAQSLQPRFVLSETHLFDEDGFELCQQLRHLPALAHSHVLLLGSENPDPEQLQRARRSGATQLLPRSIPQTDFLNLLDTLLRLPPPEPPTAIRSPEDWNHLQSALQAATRENQTLKNRLEEARTVQDQLEGRLRHAQRLGALGMIASGFAHDFNNILTGILGLSELGLRSHQNPDASRRNFEDIRIAGHRASRIVQAILCACRQEQPTLSPLCPKIALQETLTILRTAFPPSVRVLEEISASPLRIVGEMTLLQQILMNLLLNAWHALGDQPGTIRIRLESQNPSSRHLQRCPQLLEKPYVCFQVIDSGSGIAPENLEHIFDPFFTTKTAGQGTGLGLWVARGIVDSWFGALTVESSLGHGSTFSLYLPHAE